MGGRITFLLSLVLSWVIVGLLGIASSLYLLEYRTKFVLPEEEITFPHSISRIHLLPDGRRLGFKIYGNPTAYDRAVIYFHGTPGSRLLVPPALRYWSESAQFMFVAFDRPGYGLSDYDNQFSFTSVCQDVAHLATALKLERIVLVGMSTGADFALACALDDTISKMAFGIMLVSPAVPPGFSEESYATNPALDVLIHPTTPSFALRAFTIVERALLHTVSHKPEMLEETAGSKPDKAFARTNADFLIRGFKDAQRNSSLGSYRDLATLIHGDWSFLNEVDDLPTANIVTMHGELDRSINWTAGMDLCELIPHCTFELREGEGHISILGASFTWQLSSMFDTHDIYRRKTEMVEYDLIEESDDDKISMDDLADAFEES